MLFFESLFKTVYSPAFYKKATDKGMKKAVAVFFGFSVLITVVASVIFFIQSTKVVNELPEILGDFPDIYISNEGVLTLTNLSEPMPITFAQNGFFMGIDTTGELTSIPSEYAQGILFTETEMIFKDPSYPGEVMNYTYFDLLSSMEVNELSINGELISKWVTTFLDVAKFVYPLFAFVWFFFVRFIGLLFVILGVWVLFEISKIKYSFRKAFITVLYASIPVFYVGALVSFLNNMLYKATDINLMTTCCLIGFLLFLIKWGIFIGIAYMGLSEKSEEDVASEAQPI